jgi:hypothetical protein
MNWSFVIGDAFWILALSIIANALWRARGTIPAGVRLPLPWGFSGVRVGRDGAFAVALGVPFILSLALLIASRSPQLAGQTLLMALVRVFTAGLAASLNVFWLNGVLRRGGE